MAEEKASMWLRITEIIIGLIVLVLGGYVVAYPGIAAATLIGFLAVGIFILSFVEFARIFSEGISGWQRLLRLILSVIVFLLAIAILVSPLIWGGLTLAWLVGLALIFLGFVAIARATPGMIVVGIIAVIVGFVVFLYPPLGVATAVLFAGDSSDHIRVRVNSIGPLGKMGVTPPFLLFSVIPRGDIRGRTRQTCAVSSRCKTIKSSLHCITRRCGVFLALLV